MIELKSLIGKHLRCYSHWPCKDIAKEMGEVENIISDNKRDSHERYLEIYKIVLDRDKKLAQMFDGFSRSKALVQLVMYCDNNLLNDEELAQLSEETRERILAILDIRKDQG